MTIRSIRHRALKRLVERNEVKGVAPDKANRIRNILAALILAEDIDDFKSDAPPGWRIHRLSGDRQESWSVSVSGNWRITFELTDGEIAQLNLEDYH